MDRLSKWGLKSLTIGPQSNDTDTAFWEEAFSGLPPLPGVVNVTVIYNYPRVGVFDIDCWKYFDRALTRRELFPALKTVYVQTSCGSQQLSRRRWLAIYRSLSAIRERRLGPCESLTFKRDRGPDPPCETQTGRK